MQLIASGRNSAETRRFCKTGVQPRCLAPSRFSRSVAPLLGMPHAGMGIGQELKAVFFGNGAAHV